MLPTNKKGDKSLYLSPPFKTLVNKATNNLPQKLELMSTTHTVTLLSTFCQAVANVNYQQVNVQYVTDALPASLSQSMSSSTRHQHVAVKSYLGSGKTHFIKQRVLKTKLPVLVVGHRKTLLKQQASALELNYYETSSAKVKRLAVTLDSLHKVNLPDFRGAVVVLDELEQVLKHLTGNTSVKSVRKQVYQSLQFLLTHASQVVACDGDLSELGVSWLLERLGNQELAVVENIRKAPSKNVVMLPTKASTLDKVLDLLRAGKNVYVCSSSKTLLDFVLTKVNQELPNVTTKSITSDNSQTDESQEFLSNASKQSKRYQLLLASPSLGTGVDITNNHFHATVGLYDALDHMAATDVGQHLARVRNLVDNQVFLWVSKQQVSGLPLTYTQVEKHVNVGNDPSFYDLNQATGKFEATNVELANSYSKLYCNTTSRHNQSVKDLRANVVKHLQEQGHTVVYDKQARGSEKTKQELKTWSALKKQELVNLVLAAPDANKEQVQALRNKETLTPQERATVERYYLREQTLLEPTQELVEWYLNDNGRSKLTNYKQTFVLTHDELRKSWDYERGEFKEDRQRLLSKRQLRDSLLQHDTFKTLLAGGSVTSKTMQDESLTQLLRENKDALQALLGVTYNESAKDSNTKVVKFVLEQLGLNVYRTVNSERKGSAVLKTSVYSLAGDSHKLMERVANLQQNKLERERQEQELLLDVF